MINDLTIEPIVNEIRNDRGRIDIRDLEAKDPDGSWIPVSGFASVTTHSGNLTLELVIDDRIDLPAFLLERSIVKGSGPVKIEKGHYIPIRAKTLEGTAVTLDRVCPPGRSDTRKSIERLFLRFHRLILPPEGNDCLNSEQISDRLRRLTMPKKVNPDTSTEDNSKREPVHKFFAVLPNVSLRIRNDGITVNTEHPHFGSLKVQKGDCLVMDHFGGRFCIESKDGDLLVYFRCPQTLESRKYRAAFQGILEAIGFTHSFHPWPVYLEHRSDHKVVERWCRPDQKIQRNSLRPLSDGCLDHSSEGRELFLKAARFFGLDGEHGPDYRKALWLIREASPRAIAMEVQTLTLCSTLEGLLGEYSDDRNSDGNPNLGGRNKEEKWREAVMASGLPWDNFFDAIFDSFTAFRNDLAHGFRITPDSDSSLNILDAYSRISAGIYALMAKRMGYCGRMPRSLLETNDEIVLED